MSALPKETPPPRSLPRELVAKALMLLVAVLFLLPLLWMLTASLKPTQQSLSTDLLPHVSTPAADASDAVSHELSAIDPRYWTGVAQYAASNYHEVWTTPAADFPLYLKNSIFVTLLAVTGNVLSSAVAAYGFSRLRWRGRDTLFLLVLATMMIPFAVLMAPSYLLFKKLGWIGTLLPLWAPSWFGGAFSIFLLRQFFLTLPRELDEAAMMDGCSHVGILFRILLPVSRPALAVTALFAFIATWNDFIGPLIFLNHQEQFTLAVGLQMYQSQHGGTPWNLLMAASVLVVLPIVIVFCIAQRTFVEGIATTGSKE